MLKSSVTFLLSSLLSLGLLSACASTRPMGADIGPRLDKAEYQKKMWERTQVDKRYDGFHQLYETYVTLIDSGVQSLVLQKKSDLFQWDQAKAQKEREKMFQENSSATEFFLVMYTPNRKLTDLHRGNSMWKIYLEVNGERYESKVKKIKGHLENIQSIYPSLNRFSVPYKVSFNVPLGVAEVANSKFILTSALGTTELVFKARSL